MSSDKKDMSSSDNHTSLECGGGEVDIDGIINTLPITPDDDDGQVIEIADRIQVVIPNEYSVVAVPTVVEQRTKDEAAESGSSGEATIRPTPPSAGNKMHSAVETPAATFFRRSSFPSVPGLVRFREGRKRVASSLANEMLEMLKTFSPEEADQIWETATETFRTLDSWGVDTEELVKLTADILKLTAERQAWATTVSMDKEKEIQKQLADLKETLIGKARSASRVQERVDIAVAEETSLPTHAKELKARVEQLGTQLEECRKAYLEANAQIREASNRQEKERTAFTCILDEQGMIQQEIATLEAELTHLTTEGLLPSQVLQQIDDRLAEAKSALEYQVQLKF